MCDYCGNVFSIKEIEALYPESGFSEFSDTAENGGSANTDSPEWEYQSEWGEEASNLKVYNCPSCGAQLFCEETTAATSCPYCGNNTIIPSQFSGDLKPDFVIPFKYTKEQAISRLNDFYKDKKLLPKEFEDKNHIEEIKGVYIPFWLYDGTVSADVQCNATKVNVSRIGDEQITTTEFYSVQRSGDISFAKIPADASSKAPDIYMDAIEPFDYSELVPFSTAYLPGFLADIYDVSAQDAASRILKRAVDSSLSIVKQDISGFSTCNVLSQNAEMHDGYVHYALMPVWILSTRWNDKLYLFTMNGQTGKMIGDLPVSRKKYFKYFASIALPMMAILSYFLIWGEMLF